MISERKGIALGYSGGKGIPEILFKARGELVDKLIVIARENNITIYRDADLAETLSALDDGTAIPEHLFQAMAEVLAYCYKINDKFRDKLDASLT